MVASPPGDPRLFAVIEVGQIYIVDRGSLVPDPFFDVADSIPGFAGGNQVEIGLLGLAFDPDYETNRRFYVFYTAHNPDDPGGYPFLDVLARYTASASDPNKADPTSATVVLSIPDFADNHNGGMIEFGTDGYLYIGTGDGGAQRAIPRAPARTRTRCSARSCASTSTTPRLGKPYGIPPTTRSPTAAASPRSSSSACAIRGGGRSIARPATCGSATSARTRSRSSTVLPADAAGRQEPRLEHVRGQQLLPPAM